MAWVVLPTLLGLRQGQSPQFRIVILRAFDIMLSHWIRPPFSFFSISISPSFWVFGPWFSASVTLQSTNGSMKNKSWNKSSTTVQSREFRNETNVNRSIQLFYAFATSLRGLTTFLFKSRSTFSGIYSERVRTIVHYQCLRENLGSV